MACLCSLHFTSLPQQHKQKITGCNGCKQAILCVCVCDPLTAPLGEVDETGLGDDDNAGMVPTFKAIC
jgi:hypothetical protein